MDVEADLSDFSLGSMLRLVPALRELSANCGSVEQFAQRMSEFLHGAFVDGRGRLQTALVRVYGTAALGDLPTAEQQFVARTAPGLHERTMCLALLGTAGTRIGWQDRTASQGHRVIPLRDSAQVGRLPMIAALLTQLGIDIHALVAARTDIVLPARDDGYRVFYVPDAAGSPVIPAQDFVAEHGIASALGFGGALPGGEMYAVVLFSTVPVPLTAASLFGTVALSTSLAAVDMMDLPLLEAQTPQDGGAGRRRSVPRQERDRVRHELTQALLRTHEQVALAEADRAAAALAQAKYDAGRAAAIAVVALRLGSVRSVAEITEHVVRDGLPILGASGASLALTEEDGRTARLYVSSTFSTAVRRKYSILPLDDAVPTTLTARTGTPVFVTDRIDGTARFPALAPMYADTGVEALASWPLVVDERLLGCVTFTWATPMVFAPAAMELMSALAAQAAQAVDRVRLLDVERDQSATLQRSFLNRPARPTDVDIEVRYQPAAKNAQIGGDWYDAFVGPDGATMIAVGDVVGHDMLAAAVMGQVRNLLRGIVFSRPGSPAETLRYLEAALTGLEFESSATVFLARLEPAADASGHRWLEWCNAGHPPPLLVDGLTGVVEILGHEPDLMIGVQPETSRTVHHRLLTPGSLVLLYTDGLVERRGEDLDDGISRLALALGQNRDSSLEGVADDVLALSSGPREDDAAVLALRLPSVEPPGSTNGGASGTAAESFVQLPPEPASVAAARRAVRVLLADCGRARWVDTAELVVSELVTNAVLHAHTDLTMHAWCGDELRVEVRDGSAAVPVPREYGAEATTGRGMGLIAALTQDHGVTRLPDGGKAVWVVITDASISAETDELGAWADVVADLAPEPPGTMPVWLRRMPATLWLAAVQQHDALLRELALLRGSTGDSTDDLAAADHARAILQAAVDTALASARADGTARSPLPANHPGVLDDVPPELSLELPVVAFGSSVLRSAPGRSGSG